MIQDRKAVLLADHLCELAGLFPGKNALVMVGETGEAKVTVLNFTPGSEDVLFPPIPLEEFAERGADALLLRDIRK